MRLLVPSFPRSYALKIESGNKTTAKVNPSHQDDGSSSAQATRTLNRRGVNY